MTESDGNASSSDAERYAGWPGFAIEQSLLAWSRTAIALLGLGFVIARFGLLLRTLEPPMRSAARGPTGVSFWIGTSLIALGVFVSVLGIVENRSRGRRLARVTGRPASSAALSVMVALALVGTAMVTHLLLAAQR
ncbi:MAG TPA: DUF202 domain-containing protein [Candidatus Binatia bacterium]|nr:DUF202 domain-containing protein [Candidatus Binatia bacterium]